MSANVLGLNLVEMAGPGRLPVPVAVEYVRDLTEADLKLMATKPVGSVAPNLKRVTERHHALARLLAIGTKDEEAALIVGYDISRVSILKSDPAFQELLALYQSEVKKEFMTSVQRMGMIAQDALGVLADRLEENPDRFTNNELAKISTEFVDRVSDSPDEMDLPDIIELVTPDVAAE